MLPELTSSRCHRQGSLNLLNCIAQSLENLILEQAGRLVGRRVWAQKWTRTNWRTTFQVVVPESGAFFDSAGGLPFEAVRLGSGPVHHRRVRQHTAKEVPVNTSLW
jgi:hypothetical protein